MLLQEYIAKLRFIQQETWNFRLRAGDSGQARRMKFSKETEGSGVKRKKSGVL